MREEEADSHPVATPALCVVHEDVLGDTSEITNDGTVTAPVNLSGDDSNESNRDDSTKDESNKSNGTPILFTSDVGGGGCWRSKAVGDAQSSG